MVYLALSDVHQPDRMCDLSTSIRQERDELPKTMPNWIISSKQHMFGLLEPLSHLYWPNDMPFLHQDQQQPNILPQW